jgi:hypothetical protein
MLRTLTPLAIALILYPSIGTAFGSDDKWSSGFGQGTKEALVTHGPGNKIYVACQEGSLTPSSIHFTLGGDSPNGDHVFLSFDDHDPVSVWISDGMITSDCRACAANFDFVVNKLKQYDSVYVMFENGLGTRFTLNGSSEAIGDCVAGYYK